MNKTDIFKREIGYIKDEKVKKSLIYMIEKLPDYFFEVPASSTGKHHPKYALGEGGLLRHTKAAVRIGYELLENPAIGNKYTDKEKDLMLMGLLLHDGLKLGIEKGKYTKIDHPILMKDYLINESKNLQITKKEVEFVGDVIKTHMGFWTTDYEGNEVLEKPKTKYQNFVHMCDFLASRKVIQIIFDDDNNIID